MGYQLETTALISIDNYNAFRITCIMLILEYLKKSPLNKIKYLYNSKLLHRNTVSFMIKPAHYLQATGVSK